MVSRSHNRQLYPCINRILLPKCAVDMVASALSYTAVIDALDQGPEELKRKFMNTNGLLDLSHEPLLFPCCIEYVICCVGQHICAYDYI